MSRYRNNRDEDFYGGRRGGGQDDHRTSARGEFYGGRSDYFDDDPLRFSYGRDVRGSAGGGRREDYGWSERYDERPGYGARGGRDYDYGYERGGRGRFEREEDERAAWDEGGDYRRERFGGGRRGRERGAARSHVRCRDIMTRDVTVATRDTTLEEVARMMRDEDTGVIPVVDRTRLTDESPNAEANRVGGNVVGGGKLIGLITDRDIVVRALAEGKDARTTRAEEIMTTDIHTAHPNDRVIEAIRKMGDKQVRRIPIVDRDGNLRGIISMADVALETEDDHELAEALEEISSGSSFWNRIFG